MYFPYLYARRAELLALRSVFSDPDLRSTIIPILEPVKEGTGDLSRCLTVLAERQVKSIVVTNPKQGEFKQTRTHPPANVTAWRASISTFVASPFFIPGFICRPETRSTEIDAFFARYPNRDLALLYWSPRMTDQELRGLVAKNQVRFHINMHGQLSRSQRAILPSRKAVDVTDRFNAQDRNADYMDPEFFSDQHLVFRENAIGYGDYSVLGQKFVEGGGPAHAVAIHGVYIETETNNLWVEHFVSDDTDKDVGSTAGKYLQAARKLTRSAARRRREFGNNQALQEYANDVSTDKFPGLMVNKQRMLNHHIVTNHRLLVGN